MYVRSEVFADFGRDIFKFLELENSPSFIDD